MRVLWITNDVLDVFLPFVKGNPTRGGSWITPLFFGLHKTGILQLGVLSPVVNGERQIKVIEGATYYSIPVNSQDENNSFINNKLAKEYMLVVQSFNPDIIHIHGTEKNFGLIREFIPAHIPIVCSIQGIISSYYPFLSISVSNININKYKSLKNWLGRGGVYGFKKKWARYLEIEKKIFGINEYFIGRTLWDKSNLYGLNKNAKYFTGEELLRPAFESYSWSIQKCKRHSIFMSSGAYSIKGLHILLNAMALLKIKFPRVELHVPLFELNQSKLYGFFFGEDYRNFIINLISELELTDNVRFYKRLSADEMAQRLQDCHVFVLSSFIENSSNSLGEAMCVGIPSVTSVVGGTLSIVEDGKSTLAFPSSDFCYLAHQIGRIFVDDSLAIEISENAKKIALKRHNKETVPLDYISIYREIIVKNNLK